MSFTNFEFCDTESVLLRLVLFLIDVLIGLQVSFPLRTYCMYLDFLNHVLLIKKLTERKGFSAYWMS